MSETRDDDRICGDAEHLASTAVAGLKSLAAMETTPEGRIALNIVSWALGGLTALIAVGLPSGRDDPAEAEQPAEPMRKVCDEVEKDDRVQEILSWLRALCVDLHVGNKSWMAMDGARAVREIDELSSILFNKEPADAPTTD